MYKTKQVTNTDKTSSSFLSIITSHKKARLQPISDLLNENICHI